MKQYLLLFTLLIAGCASVKVTDGARRVRFVTESPTNCEYLGEISGHFKEAMEGGGIVGNEASFAHAALKNNAAELGADTVQVMWNTGREKGGEAYRCGRAPAAQ